MIDTPRHAQRGAALVGRGIVEHLLTLGPSDIGGDLITAPAGLDDSACPLEVQPDDVAEISYTGGTTGKPKGVVQRQRTAVTMTLQRLSCGNGLPRSASWPRRRSRMRPAPACCPPSCAVARCSS